MTKYENRKDKCYCGREKMKTSKHCHKCAGIARRGKNSPFWRGGRKGICPSCGKEKWKESRYCQSCASKLRVGASNPIWKGGLPNCINCGKQVSRREYTRCVKCELGHRVGDKHPNWTGGLSHCLDCDIELARYGGKRCWRCHVKHQVRENHPSWRGGSDDPYSLVFNDALRKKIRSRDNHTCAICWLQENGRLVSVHHIDYDKNNSESSNLISLCSSCHMTTNHNRSYWQLTLAQLMQARGHI